MRHAYIIYSQFFDRSGEKIQIGGIETYIYNLCKVLFSENLTPIIYQFADKDFFKEYCGIKVAGVKVNSRRYKKNSKLVVKKIEENFDIEEDLLIFASEEYVVTTKAIHVIALQHGVSWDVPNDKKVLTNYVKNMTRAIIEYKRIKKCSYVICVDYNFLNWYRATFRKMDYEKFKAIPNFCETSPCPKEALKKDGVTIVFARRFVKHRGAILFANVAKRILDEYANVKICFAGDGICKKEMKAILYSFPNVTFTSFSADKSVEFHSNFDIAVVPTIGSEGTSLSLLEAMAAGCSVISTNVGGITNILIDRYNGRIVNATEEEIYLAVKELINNRELRLSYAQKGKEVAQVAFSKKIWEEKWRCFLQSIN